MTVLIIPNYSSLCLQRIVVSSVLFVEKSEFNNFVLHANTMIYMHVIYKVDLYMTFFADKDHVVLIQSSQWSY